MDNMYLPPVGPQNPSDPASSDATWPGTVNMTSQLSPQAPPPPRRRGRAARWTAIGVAAAALLGGGAVAVANVTSAPAPVAAGAGPSGQAAVLSNVLGSAGSKDSGAALAATGSTPAGTAIQGKVLARCARLAKRLRQAGHPGGAQLVRRFCARRLLRLRLLGGLHGQFTFRTRKGIRTLAFERGVIQAVSGSGVVVRAADGTTWPWDLVAKTVVREDGKRTAKSSLATGERVFVGGPVTGGANDARLIVIAKAAGGTSG